MDINDILNIPPYSLDKSQKSEMLDRRIKFLTRHHYNNCLHYRRILDAEHIDISNLPHYSEMPMLPVRLFKEYELRSCAKDEIVKTMTSSGTTGQQVSRIYLDRDTSSLQTRCLTKIVSSFIGQQRVPMLIIDSSSVVKNRRMFSARGAGILGFSMFGNKRAYALTDEMELDIETIKSFLEQNKSAGTIFLFGFTFMIWQHFYKKLIESGYHPDLKNAILIHGGGWKKLLSEKITTEKFKQALHEACGIRPENIHDYYGMVEQTGSIYMECEYGHLHTSAFSDIIIRRPGDFSVAAPGEKGLIEVISVLPQSYPGHILLTEDEGILLGEEDCPCLRKGKYFKIEGRIKNAEIRGCSDTYATKF
ncbi:acyl-protein synthetase [uncultured Muribaculum sp.]|uniref:LuxE/PaaK family acyltransferase n=1 Tax=uncultured Muribaculum sp. TaxID=1918613 RepID=UPI00266EBA8E|nr:acyl-protein synthetase [uncultured Muribaculum sp.]